MAFDPNVSSAVAGIEFFGEKIYIGGNFLSVNGFTVPRSGLAALDPVTGAADPTFNPGLTGWFGAVTQIVTGTARSGSTLYVAGNFSKVSGTVTRNNLAAIDLTTGTVTAFDPNVDKPGLAIAADGAQVYAGGFFSFAGADSIATGVVALKPDGTRDTAFAPVISPAIGISSLAVAGGRLIVGSDFGLVVEGTGRQNLAALDLASGALVPAFDPKVNFGVAALAVAGGKVYAGGDFTTVNGSTPRNHLAAFDPATGAADPAFDPNVDRAVYALAFAPGGGKLYAGGRFTTVNGALPRGGLVAFDPATGAADPAFSPTVDDDVRALAVGGGRVYIGGSLRSIDGVTRRMIGAVDAATGALEPFNPDVLGQVRAILVAGGTVYVGGSIARVNGGVERHGVAALDGATGTVASDLGASFTGGSVNALLLAGSRLHAGGSLFEPDGVLHLDYARFSEPAAPVVVSGAASAVGDAGASVAGTVNPGGIPATYVFEYGTSPSFGSVTPAEDVAGATAAPVSAQLTGLAPNTTYYYRLVATSSAGTTFGGARSFRTTGVAQAPLAVTGAASAVGNTSATVGGQVNPRGQLTATTFEYGTSLSFGAMSPVVALDDADALEPVSVALTGLAPATTYYVRVVATNATGTALGAVAAFTTAGTLAPLAATGAATAVTTTGATLAGVVDPRGTPTAFTFEYGPTNAFGSIAAVDSATGGAQPVSLTIDGLAAGTQYRFRIVATNAFGTAAGTVGTFTTATGA